MTQPETESESVLRKLAELLIEEWQSLPRAASESLLGEQTNDETRHTTPQ